MFGSDFPHETQGVSTEKTLVAAADGLLTEPSKRGDFDKARTGPLASGGFCWVGSCWQPR